MGIQIECISLPVMHLQVTYIIIEGQMVRLMGHIQEQVVLLYWEVMILVVVHMRQVQQILFMMVLLIVIGIKNAIAVKSVLYGEDLMGIMVTQQHN